MKNYLLAMHMALFSLLVTTTFSQARIDVSIKLPDSTTLVSKQLKAYILHSLTQHSGIFVVDRNESSRLSHNSVIVDGRGRALTGADYLLSIDFSRFNVVTSSEINANAKLGPCKKNTIVKAGFTFEIKISEIESGLVINVENISTSVEQINNCELELHEQADAYVTSMVIGRFSDAILNKIYPIIEKSISMEFPILGEAYRRGNKISGLIVTCPSSYFSESQTFEIYSRSTKKLGSTTIDKNVYLCDASYFEDLGKYSTLILKKPSNALQKAIENNERIVAVLKK